MEKLSSIKPNRFVISPSSSRSERIGHFIPRPSRDPAEIARRKAQPKGSLVLEEQSKGLTMTQRGLQGADNFSELVEWADIAAPALIGSGQYLMNGAIMHRYVPLPMLVSEKTGAPRTIDFVREQALHQLEHAISYADILLAAHTYACKSKYERIRLAAGRKIVQAGLTLGVLELSEDITASGLIWMGSEIQELVRDRAIDTVRRADDIGLEIGAIATTAQLPDPLSPLSVELQRSGSDAVERLYQSAMV